MIEICKNCKWFDSGTKWHGMKVYGYCNRYPTPVDKHENGFCGEFTPKMQDNKEFLKEG